MLPESFLDELGITVRSRNGDELWASCPLPSHPGIDANPSFSINVEKEAWFCFACGEGGTLDKLADILLGTGVSSLNSLKRPGDLKFVEQIEKYLQRQPEARTKRPVLPWFSSKGLDYPSSPWFAERGISEDVRKVLRMGYDSQHPRGAYAGPAIVIPHFFHGQLVGWQVRWLDDQRPSFIPKYTMSAGFPKKSTLYNYDYCRHAAEPPILVESVMTVAVLLSHGYPAMASFGASVADEQIRLLRGFQQGVVLSYDNDGPGRVAEGRLEEHLSQYIPLQRIPPPEGSKGDLGDLRGDELHSHIEHGLNQ